MSHYNKKVSRTFAYFNNEMKGTIYGWYSNLGKYNEYVVVGQKRETFYYEMEKGKNKHAFLCKGAKDNSFII